MARLCGAARSCSSRSTAGRLRALQSREAPGDRDPTLEARQALEHPRPAGGRERREERLTVRRIAGLVEGRDHQAGRAAAAEDRAHQLLHQEDQHRGGEQRAEEGQQPGRRGERGGDDDHQEADLLGLLDRRPEAHDRERAEEAERERQRELDADEDRGHRDGDERKGAVDLAAGGAPAVELDVELGDDDRRDRRDGEQQDGTSRRRAAVPCPPRRRSACRTSPPCEALPVRSIDRSSERISRRDRNCTWKTTRDARRARPGPRAPAAGRGSLP